VRPGGTTSPSIQGVPLSYLNLFDAAAAWEMAHDLARDGDRGRRHRQARQPVRGGDRTDLADTYQRAFDCDARSAFGGIVAFSHRST
jgi:phosphoribosylaminoimidazolecarboxamide formyltransferase / IMP cyclohydrolase